MDDTSIVIIFVFRKLSYVVCICNFVLEPDFFFIPEYLINCAKFADYNHKNCFPRQS